MISTVLKAILGGLEPYIGTGLWTGVGTLALWAFWRHRAAVSLAKENDELRAKIDEIQMERKFDNYSLDELVKHDNERSGSSH